MIPERHGDIEMEFRGIFGRGRASMLDSLKMLGAMGSIFGMGMGGAVATSAKGVNGSRKTVLGAKEYARRKKRQEMARESRRRNRQNRKAS